MEHAIGRRAMLGATAATLVTGYAARANAQAALPPVVHLIVPNVAGGTTDILARIVAAAISREGLKAVVENVAGASGGIAQAKVVASAPDGATMLLAGANNVLLDVIDKTQKMQALAPIAGVASLPMVLVGRPTLEPRTIDELVEYARAPGRNLNIAAGGTGTLPHLGAIGLQAGSKAQMTFVPYKGAPNMLPDLIGGHIDLAVLLLPAAMSNICSGTVKAYGLFSPRRAEMAPDIPSLLESRHLRDMALFSDFWTSVFISAKTPPELRDKLSAIFTKALSSPEARKQISESGSSPMPLGAEEVAKLIRTDTQSFEQIISANQIKFK